MTRDFKKVKLRRQGVGRWVRGFITANGREPTDIEFKVYIAGFNMGYKAGNKKRI
jgi:hypothetical protein